MPAFKKAGPNALRGKPWWRSQSYQGAAALIGLGLARPLAERYGLRLPDDVWTSLFWGALGLMGVGIRNAQARTVDSIIYGVEEGGAPATPAEVPRYQPGQAVPLPQGFRPLMSAPAQPPARQYPSATETGYDLPAVDLREPQER